MNLNTFLFCNAYFNFFHLHKIFAEKQGTRLISLKWKGIMQKVPNYSVDKYMWHILSHSLFSLCLQVRIGLSGPHHHPKVK